MNEEVEYFELPADREIHTCAVSAGVYCDPINGRHSVCLQFGDKFMRMPPEFAAAIGQSMILSARAINGRRVVVADHEVAQ